MIAKSWILKKVCSLIGARPLRQVVTLKCRLFMVRKAIGTNLKLISERDNNYV
jgi:hypothetical protein